MNAILYKIILHKIFINLLNQKIIILAVLAFPLHPILNLNHTIKLLVNTLFMMLSVIMSLYLPKLFGLKMIKN